jgi:hypothetical protein
LWLNIHSESLLVATEMLSENDRRVETIRMQVDHWAYDKEQEQKHERQTTDICRCRHGIHLSEWNEGWKT